MKLKVQQPLPERKDVFDESVKPLLLAAESNNALDKWMYNLKNDGKPDFNSIVFVSTKFKKIFIIKYLLETKQPPKFKYKKGQALDFFAQKIARRQFWTKKPHKTSKDKYLDALQTWGRAQSKYVDVLQTWTASVGYWDLTDSWYTFSSFSLESGSKVLTLEELSKDIDFELWVKINREDSKHFFHQGNLLYHSISKKWKLNEDY